MDEKSLGKRLQAARQAAGMTQQQLCSAANLSFSTLTKIERGAIKSPSIFTVQSIAEALNLSLDDLLGGSKATSRSLRTTKSGVRFIYFDVNGCLVHYYQRAFAMLATKIGVPSDSVETAFWHYNDEVCRGAMSMNDFNAAFAKRLGVEKIDWLNEYLTHVEPVKPMQELMIEASKQYHVGLLTNIMPFQLAGMRKNGKLPDIKYDAVVDSSELGMIKPEKAIYEVALQRAGCKPEEILLIDDTRANLVAAEKQGWHVLWFNDAQSHESTNHVRQALEL
jgi:HAD superfamily hydrolase (TIGR01509 family)